MTFTKVYVDQQNSCLRPFGLQNCIYLYNQILLPH